MYVWTVRGIRQHCDRRDMAWWSSPHDEALLEQQADVDKRRVEVWSCSWCTREQRAMLRGLLMISNGRGGRIDVEAEDDGRWEMEEVDGR